ncbi:adenine-specific DNA-methyltransferase [Caloranaerobacter azorensis DSM 13643]|uniref:site-specific DNA-methyltransferase (adenine-specific) n=1 Tax=Caloranaerobacter azorensis DSM 13643 TaxID=1121264 RepID=A0A1M5UMI4_9FIRM|nr:N-6 DNA methylase [Caloranaerobacter azorensis]SHH64179.1 adenine-specific DNA-methyltransferase [Caloranaerobacter azorensis DSM 13643]
MKNKAYEKELIKAIKKYLYRYKNEGLDIYISKLKGIIYYIGKAILSISYYRSEKITEKDLNDILNNDSIERLPEKFKEFEISFGKKVIFTGKQKDEIVSLLNKLESEELCRISLGKLYEELITSKERKQLGQVYTPRSIVKYMIDEGIKEEYIIKNPYFKVIDPACGGGYFLIEAYEKIKSIMENNYEKIIYENPAIKMQLDEGIHEFILRNNIWGTDVDEFAVYMTTISLLLKDTTSNSFKLNIYKKDILLDDEKNLLNSLSDKSSLNDIKFDLVIGNPPYIGHKKINKIYRQKLIHYYYDVFSDKADISFCFVKKGHDLLKEDGRLILITSRYFIESPSGKFLRKFIKNNFTIESLIDFNGYKIFRGIGVSPLIIKCIKGKMNDTNFDVYKLKKKLNQKNEFDIANEAIYERFKVKSIELADKGWIFINPLEKLIFEKIDSQGDYKLKDICESYQGIITGCDSAFIIDAEKIDEGNLERDILKPWIKNSYIQKYTKTEVDKYILYTDLIDNIDDYPNTLKHILPYKERLEKRRECIKGIRKWYELQWGRNLEVFKSPKIIFPFKSETNRFMIDYDNLFCSADVYIIKIKDMFLNEITMEYLTGFLNSLIFEFYFKTVAKKVGDNMYDFYPNKLMELNIKIGEDVNFVSEKVKKIISYYNDINRLLKDKVDNRKIEELQIKIIEEIEKIDKYFFTLYKLEHNEVETIKNRLK